MPNWEDAPEVNWEDAPDSGKEVDKALGSVKSGAKKVAGTGEAVLSMLAGIPAQIASGYVGLGNLMVGNGVDTAGRATEDFQRANFGAGQYVPVTDKGKEYSENVSKVFAAPGEYAGKLGGKIGKELGNEALGELSLKLPVDVAMNFLPLKVPGFVKKGVSAFERPQKPVREFKEPSLDASLWEDAPQQPTVVQGAAPENAGYNAFDKILESQISGEQSPVRTRPAMEVMAEQLRQQADATKQAQVQALLEQRQRAMEMEVAQRQGLDFNAAERARQENAPVPGLEAARLAEEARKAAEIQASIDKTQELNTRGQQMNIVEDYGNNDPMSRMPEMRVDENGIPIRADLSMEAQNLQNPLQRNLWGDELGPALDQGRSLTDAIDSMPPSHARDMTLSQLTGQPPARSTTTMRKDFWSNKQRGAINPNVLKWRDTPITKSLEKFGERFANMAMHIQTSPYGPEITITKNGEQVASLFTQVKGENLEVGRVAVNPEYRNMGLAKMMYETLTHTGNDVARSATQLADGKAMWDHWESSGFAKNGMLNKKQRGAVDLNEIGNGLRGIYSKFENAVNDMGKVNLPKTITADDHARSIPGMGNALDGMFVKPKSAAEILPSILGEKDGPPLWKGIQQGLSATAEKVGSSLMRYTSDWLNYVDKKTEFDYKKLVRPTQDMLTNLPKIDKVNLSKVLLNEMFNKKRFTPEELSGMGLNEKQMAAYKALRSNLDMIADRYDASRAKLGLPPIDRGEAYVAATRQGAYHVVLQSVDGRPLWHVAEHSMRDAYKFINWAKENLKDVPGVDLKSLDKHLESGVIPGTVKSDTMHRPSNKFYNVPRDVLGAHLELAKLIDGNDPSVSAIREAIQAAAEKAGYDVTNTKQRFMDKANVRGFEGDKPWLTPEQNANSLLNSQLQTIKEGLNWSYHQDMVAQLKELLSNPELQAKQPNNVGMVNTVLSHQLGLTKSIFKDAESWVAHNVFGADRAGIKKAVQDMKTFTYLQQLGMSTGYVIATPLQALNSIGAAFRERGLGALSPVTASKAMADGLGALLNDMSLELTANGDVKVGKAPVPMTEIGKLALQYAEDNGIVNKLLFNAGHEIPKVDSAPGTFRKMYSATMSVPEKVSRIMPFMAFVHHLNDMGTYKNPMDIFKRAEELTEFTQINFRGSEKPTLVKDLGSVGDLAYVYKGPIFNYFNQLSTYARNVANGTNRARNLAALTGLIGVTAYLGGALSLPLLNEMDGAYNLYKNAVAKLAPASYSPDIGIKGSIISKLDKSVAYGAISDITGAQMSSRFTPNMLDVEKPLSGIAPVATEIGEQEAVAKFIGDPTRKNFVQGVYANAPPVVRGLMENNLPEFKGPARSNGTQTFVNPNDIGAQRAMVNRTPEQQSYRNWGLRQLDEARKVDLNKINDAEQRRVETAVDGLTDKMFYAMIKDKDQKAVAKYGAKMLELMPDGNKLNAAIEKKVAEYSTTPEERMQIKADMVQNLMRIKRLRDAANK